MNNVAKFTATVIALLVLTAATFPWLVRHTRLGLELRGGYEIIFQAVTDAPGTALDKNTLRRTADLLAARANQFGVSETVGGVLGADDLANTVQAGLIALGLVFAFLAVSCGKVLYWRRIKLLA